MNTFFKVALSLISVGLTTQVLAYDYGRYCSSAEDNPYVACASRYNPSACTNMTNGCNPAQVACLQSYTPSACENISPDRGAAYCHTVDNNPYVACIAKYNPSACTQMTNGCNAGQAACLKIYTPSGCLYY